MDDRTPLTGVTLTIDVDACGFRRACYLAAVASSAPVLKGTRVVAVVRYCRKKRLETLIRHGFDEVREADTPVGPLTDTPHRSR